MKDLYCPNCCCLLTRTDMGSHYKLVCVRCKRVSFDYKPLPEPESCGCTGDPWDCPHDPSFEHDAIREAEREAERRRRA